MPRLLPIERCRNLGIMAHIDAGKTTCTERILVYTGRLHRAGEVHEGTTQMDWTAQEQAHGITITAAATTAQWAPHAGARRGVVHRLNVLDTPGHVDFTIEVERSLRVLDGAVCLFDSARGVEPQSETVWRQADRYGVPRVAFVNKMDKVGADFAMCVASMRERLGANAVAVQLPLGEGYEHEGVVDLLERRAFVFDVDPTGQRYRVTDVPAPLRDAVETARARLVEACADVDEMVLAEFVDKGAAAVSAEALERALRAGTLARKLVPVLCGSAFKNKGVQMLLDAIVNYLPSPADLPPVQGQEPSTGAAVSRAPSDDAPLCALAFKVMADEHGALTYLRLYAGTLARGDAVLDATRGRRERVGRVLRMHANDREEVEQAYAGDIVAVVGLREARTGDTLCDPRAPLALESLAVPAPVVEVAIEPRARADQDRLSVGLARLAAEDPSLRIGTDPETGQTLLRGMGELHLQIAVERLASDHRVEARTGAPRVAYREALRGIAQANVRYVRQTGGAGQFAHVLLEVAPAEPGAGLVFVDGTRGGAVPREFVPAVQKGIAGAMSRGVLAGFPVVDVRATLLDGSFHAQDSDAHAFEIAGSLAFQQAARDAGLRLLEPVMAVEVETPEASTGDVLGDLAARRGQVRGIAPRAGAQVIDALVPLAALFGYVNALRGRTQGRATASLRFAHYETVPDAVATQVLAAAAR